MMPPMNKPVAGPVVRGTVRPPVSDHEKTNTIGGMADGLRLIGREA